MTDQALQITITRTILASPARVFDAFLGKGKRLVEMAYTKAMMEWR